MHICNKQKKCLANWSTLVFLNTYCIDALVGTPNLFLVCAFATTFLLLFQLQNFLRAVTLQSFPAHTPINWDCMVLLLCRVLVSFLRHHTLLYFCFRIVQFWVKQNLERSYEILSWKIIWDIINLDFLFAWMSAHLTALHRLRWCSHIVLVPVFLYGIVWWFSTSMILSEPFYNFLCNAVWINFQLSR